MNWGDIYASIGEVYHFPPDVVSRMTPGQIMMYANRSSEGAADDHPDDWSQFGLTRKGEHLYGPDEALERYMAYRRKLKGET